MSSDEQLLINNEEVAAGTYGGTENVNSNNETPQVPMSNLGKDISTSTEKEESTMSELSERMTCSLLLLTCLSAIGGFLFGYDTGVISGAMISLREVFDLNNFWQELIVSVAIGGAAISAFLGGFLNDWFGRKPIVLLASFVFTAGAVIMGVANSREVLLIGRIIVGFGIGFASMTVPVYIAESSPAHLRGKLVLCNNIFITAGMTVASIVDGIFHGQDNGWRYMVGLAGVPSFIQFWGFLFMPESPRWLVGQGKHDEALEALQKIRGSLSSAVNQEFEEIRQAHEENLQESRKADKRPVIIQMLTEPHTRRALLVGCGLQMFQQIAGINTVMYYSATIISMSGVRDKGLVVWLAAAVAGVNTAASFIGLYLVEKIGRRKLTIGSLFGVLISLIVLAVGFQLSAIYTPSVTIKEYGNFSSTCSNIMFCDKCVNRQDCGFCFQEDSRGVPYNSSCLQVDPKFESQSKYGRCMTPDMQKEEQTIYAYDYCPTDYSWMAVFGLVLYLICFAPGMGPMPWTINSEIYPLWARSTGNAAATAVNWIFNLLVSMTFLTLTEYLTKYGTYWLYTGLVVLGLIFIGCLLPETKGKTLEEIEESFKRPFF